MRSLYDPLLPPPPPRNTHQDRPTLLITWWCCGCCLAVIVCRFVGRYARTMRVFPDDKWMAVSAVPLLMRVGLVHAVLVLGTNNVESNGMGEAEVKRRVLGSRLVLAARVMYAVFIWSQKFCITEFYKRLTVQFWDKGYDRGLKMIRWGLLVTFAVAVISIFVECRPSHKLWQVQPDPGPECRASFVPLISLGSLNVFTDLLLVFFPIPAIIRSQMRATKKFHLIFLFSLSLLPVATSLYRVNSIIKLQAVYGQPYRSLWASLETLAACVCANAVVLNSYARDRGPKRRKFRAPSEGEDAMDRRSVRRGTRGYWGSDEDLAGDVGMGMDPELLSLTERSNRSSGVPSPIAFKSPYYFNNSPEIPQFEDRRDQDHLGVPQLALSRGGQWVFDEDHLHSALKRTKTHPPESLPFPERTHSRGRRVSFYDVGGLLRDESPGGGRGSRASTSEMTACGSEMTGGSTGESFDSVETKVGVEDMLLNDVGGLLGTVVEGEGEV